MGNDHDQRKRAKKRKGVEFEDGQTSADGRRVRKRRPAIRRLCRGMCYGEPSLTAEDLSWNGNGSEDDAPASERRSINAKLLEQQAEEAEKEAARAKRRQQNRQRRLSTAINLIDPGIEGKAQPRVPTGEGATVSAALRSFPEELQQCMADRGYTEPTPIQERCWPIILEGGDLVASAEPGSGKTLAYLMPVACMSERLKQDEQPSTTKTSAPAVLILVPTRELAQQVLKDCKGLWRRVGASCTGIIGGADKEAQIEALGRRPLIVVATPGRLLELVEERVLRLDAVKYVVLDEADKMLGTGLQPQLRRLRAMLLPKKGATRLPGPVQVPDSGKRRPQVVLFSATLTEEALGLADKWLRRPQRVHIGTTAADISRTVVQAVHVCAEHKKPAKLLKHLAHIKEKGAGLQNRPRVLIFANRIKTVRFLADTVAQAGMRCVMLHGERTQAEREEAMRDFRSGKVQAMVATDVAARGLHISNLPYVVNYDFPSRLEQYIHRAGRTGRLATNGHCYSFFTRNLAPLAQPLLDLLTEHQQAVDPNLVQLADAYKQALQKLQADPVDQKAAGKDDEAPDLIDALLAEDEGAEGTEGGLKAGADNSGKSRATRKSLPGRLRKRLARDKAKSES